MQDFHHDHFSLSVSDLEASSRWYQDVLEFEPRHVDVWWRDGACFLGRGDAMIALFLRAPGEAFSSTNMPIANHQAFRINAADYASSKQKLARLQITYREMDHGISRSVYFQDPDDYWIELTTYEGKS